MLKFIIALSTITRKVSYYGEGTKFKIFAKTLFFTFLLAVLLLILNANISEVLQCADDASRSQGHNLGDTVQSQLPLEETWQSALIQVDPALVTLHNNLHFGLMWMLIGWLLSSIYLLATYYSIAFEKSLMARFSNWPNVLKYLQAFVKARKFALYYFSFAIIPELCAGIFFLYTLVNNPIIP